MPATERRTTHERRATRSELEVTQAEPEPAAVAGGVRRILEDWDAARRLGEAGRETLRERHGRVSLL